MKKFLMITLSVMVGATGLLSLLQPTNLELAEKNLSQITYNLFTGKTDNVYATLTSGKREYPYILNGVAGEMIEFGVITVYFLVNTSAYIGQPTYKLTVDDKYYQGNLEQNPFNKAYMADVKAMIPDTSQVYLLVEWDSLYESMQMEPVSVTWTCNWEQALKVAIADIEESSFKKFIQDDKLTAEVQIQIIGDPEGIIEKQYWYINIFGQSGSVVTLAINPENCEIISKREVVY